MIMVVTCKFLLTNFPPDILFLRFHFPSFSILASNDYFLLQLIMINKFQQSKLTCTQYEKSYKYLEYVISNHKDKNLTSPLFRHSS